MDEHSNMHTDKNLIIKINRGFMLKELQLLEYTNARYTRTVF